MTLFPTARDIDRTMNRIEQLLRECDKERADRPIDSSRNDKLTFSIVEILVLQR